MKRVLIAIGQGTGARGGRLLSLRKSGRARWRRRRSGKMIPHMQVWSSVGLLKLPGYGINIKKVLGY